MPLYDYDCAACGRRFEVIQGVHADSPTTCPLCGKGPVRKAITAAAIHYKGSGWAKKERRATASAGTAKASGDGKASGDSASNSGSDSDPKPDADSKSKADSPPASESKDSGSGSPAASHAAGSDSARTID